MKRYLPFILLFFGNYLLSKPLLYAQQSDVISSVTYQFHHVTDTNNLNHAWNEKMLLLFNNNKSLYTSYSKREQAEIIKQNTQAAKANGSNIVRMKAYGPITTENIFTYLRPNERILEEQFHGDKFIIKEALPNIPWKIKQETKVIKGFTCQKAVGICKGRSYTAWFTSEIPVNFGPWKLHGLPGLIMEAYDANKWISFKCLEISKSKTNLTDQRLEIPVGIKATREQYNKMVKASQLGILGKIISGGTSDLRITNEKITGINGQPVKTRSKNMVNYPLELD